MKKINPAIIALSETRLIAEIEDCEVNISGYSVIRCNAEIYQKWDKHLVLRFGTLVRDFRCEENLVLRFRCSYTPRTTDKLSVRYNSCSDIKRDIGTREENGKGRSRKGLYRKV